MLNRDIEIYLQKAVPSRDGDKRILTLTFYRTPIDYDEAIEVSNAIGETLFPDANTPATDLGTVKFNVNLGLQNLTFFRHPELRDQARLVERVKLDGFEAMHLFPDRPDFTLAFRARFEIADPSIAAELAFELLRESFWVFLEPTPADDADQTTMFPDPELACKVCGETATWTAKDGKTGFCDEHVAAAEGEEVVKIEGG